MRRVREELLDAIEAKNGMVLSTGSPKPLDAPVFAPVSSTKMIDYSTTAAIVQIGTYTAEINNGADLETVEGVLRTLSRL
jgi:hypothetical protein